MRSLPSIVSTEGDEGWQILLLVSVSASSIANNWAPAEQDLGWVYFNLNPEPWFPLRKYYLVSRKVEAFDSDFDSDSETRII